MVYDTPPRSTLVGHDPSNFYSRRHSRQQTGNEQIAAANFQSSHGTLRNRLPQTPSCENSPEVPLQNGSWQPRQRLPLSVRDNESTSSCVDNSVFSMLQQIQGSMELNFDRVTKRLDNLRIGCLALKRSIPDLKGCMQHLHHRHHQAVLQKEVEIGAVHLNFRFVLVLLRQCLMEYFSA